MLLRNRNYEYNDLQEALEAFIDVRWESIGHEMIQWDQEADLHLEIRSCPVKSVVRRVISYLSYGGHDGHSL